MNEKPVGTILLILAAIALSYGIYRYAKQEPYKRDANTIIIGTNAEYPPYEFMENDCIVGFDIDLIGQIAQRLGKKIEIENLPFTTLIPQLQLGGIDLIAAAMSPTPQRAEQVLFSDLYLQANPLIIISKPSNPVTSLEDLAGKTVLVNEGFSADLYMSEYPGIILKRLPTLAGALLALRADQAYAFVTGANSFKPFLEQFGHDEFKIVTIPNTNEPSAFALAKDKTELAESINKVLQEMKEDGSLETLKAKWKL